MRKQIPKHIRESVKQYYNEQCAYCDSTKYLHIHHLDGDAMNNTMQNLMLVCRKCHKQRFHPMNKRL